MVEIKNPQDAGVQQKIASAKAQAITDAYTFIPLDSIINLQDLDKSFRCPLGEREHVVSPLCQVECPQCQQQFCSSCIVEFAAGRCFTCQIPTQEVKHRLLKDSLNKQKVRCNKPGCIVEWDKPQQHDNLILGELGQHVQQKHLSCPNGCENQPGSFTESSLKTHIINECNAQPVVCQNCEQIYPKDLKRPHNCFRSFVDKIEALSQQLGDKDDIIRGLQLADETNKQDIYQLKQELAQQEVHLRQLFTHLKLFALPHAIRQSDNQLLCSWAPTKYPGFIPSKDKINSMSIEALQSSSLCKIMYGMQNKAIISLTYVFLNHYMSPPLGTYTVEPTNQIDLLTMPVEDKSDGNKSPCSRSSMCSQQSHHSSVEVSGGMIFGFGLSYSSNAEQYSLSMIKVTHSASNEDPDNEITNQAGQMNPIHEQRSVKMAPTEFVISAKVETTEAFPVNVQFIVFDHGKLPSGGPDNQFVQQQPQD